MTKIMLVEDDKSLREIYGVRLLAEGYDIVSAGDGEEALAMAIKDRPDLIVSDVMMPKISGFDMLDILRSTTETKNIKVIMMTALSSDEQRQRGEQLGADKYLVKSQVGIEDVVKAVHEVLGDKPGDSTVTPQPPAVAAQPAGPPVPNSSIPQPTAPFTGQRPATLGDRVIHPLPDNPRVSNVNIGELMDKEFATTAGGEQVVAASPQMTTPVAPVPVDDSVIPSNNLGFIPPGAPLQSTPPLDEPAPIAAPIEPQFIENPIPTQATVVEPPQQYAQPEPVAPPAEQPIVQEEPLIQYTQPTPPSAPPADQFAAAANNAVTPQPINTAHEVPQVAPPASYEPAATDQQLPPLNVPERSDAPFTPPERPTPPSAPTYE